MRRALVLVLVLACAAPAAAARARVNVSRLERQAWTCALWVRARYGTRLSASNFRYELRPNRNGTATIESWGVGPEVPAFERCLREQGNDLARAPEPSAAAIAEWLRRYCALLRPGPGDSSYADCHLDP